MNEDSKRQDPDAPEGGTSQSGGAGMPEEQGNPITQQMRAVGRRRREAEEKLQQRQEEPGAKSEDALDPKKDGEN